MHARLAGILTILTVFCLAPLSLTGQTRGAPRSSQPRRGATAPARETPPSADAPAASPERNAERGERAGTATPPVQGYVPPPEPPQPGTYTGFVIPSDPLDRGTWELYDKDKLVTLTGKVTRVDWTNPNSYIYLAAEGGLWAIESGFIQFRQSSVTPAIKEEQIITVLGYLPKEPGGELPARRVPAIATYLKTNHLIRAGEITTVFGQKLLMGRPPSETEMAERLKCTAFGC